LFSFCCQFAVYVRRLCPAKHKFTVDTNDIGFVTNLWASL